MADRPKLKVSERTGAGPALVNKLRREGFVPANMYGARQDARNLQVSGRDLGRLLQHATGEQILVDLEIESGGSSENRLALIQEVQHEPLSGDILHIDFQAVSQDETIRAAVPVESVGEADGVKNFGGLLEQLVREVEVECLPNDLPELITVDVSPLLVGQSLHIKDLPLSGKVRCTADPELTVFMVAASRLSTSAAAQTEGQTPQQPEVIKEKKEAAK